VTGVDISESAVAMATNLAHATGLDARFLTADVFALPTGLGRFDVVYVSWGAICWMPDLEQWAEIIAEHLVDGGRLALFEHHPIWEVLGATETGQVDVRVNYFGRGAPVAQEYDPSRRMSGWQPETEFASFLWPVSEVLASLRRAGLTVEHFSEHPQPELYGGLNERAGWLPAIYAVIARKNATG
jgi:SAM-dependent methyltransferase